MLTKLQSFSLSARRHYYVPECPKIAGGSMVTEPSPVVCKVAAGAERERPGILGPGGPRCGKQ